MHNAFTRMNTGQTQKVCNDDPAPAENVSDNAPVWRRSMTAPKQYVPGQIRFATRRTVGGQFLLLPDETMEQIAGYCTGLAVRASRVEIYSASWMATHNHNVFGDPRARATAFYRTLNQNTTKCRNRQLVEYEHNPWGGERRGTLWDAQEAGGPKLLDYASVLEKIVYTCLNPVAAGLVRHPDDYPGFQILPRQLGEPLHYERPEYYFSPGLYRDEVTFLPAIPPGLRHLDRYVAIGLLEELVGWGAEAICRRREREGLPPVVGADRLLEARPWDFPAVQPPPRPVGRPPKKKKKGPGPVTLPLEAEVRGVRVTMDLRLDPQYPLFAPDPDTGTMNPYRVQSVRSKSVQKKVAFKRRFPREMPAQRNPLRFIAEDIERQKRAESQYTSFVKDYEKQLDAFRAGDRDVIFPAGTVRMRRIAGVKCAPAPSGAPAAWELPRPTAPGPDSETAPDSGSTVRASPARPP
jgi:hypothetical protein